jgi:hypothetical protein
MQRDGRRLRAVEPGAHVSLRVRASVGGEPADVTAQCAFTTPSSGVAVSPDGNLTFASNAAVGSLAAVIVECPSGREILGFVLDQGGS